MRFEMDPNWEREVRRAAAGGLSDMVGETQRMLDGLGRRYKGRPVGEIKPVLKREWERTGGSISDPELTQYAEHISAGRRIEFRLG